MTWKRKDGVPVVKSKPIPNKPKYKRPRRHERTGGKVWLVFAGGDPDTDKLHGLCTSLDAGIKMRDRTAGVLFEYDDDGKQLTNEKRID